MIFNMLGDLLPRDRLITRNPPRPEVRLQC